MKHSLYGMVFVVLTKPQQRKKMTIWSIRHKVQAYYFCTKCFIDWQLYSYKKELETAGYVHHTLQYCSSLFYFSNQILHPP